MGGPRRNQRKNPFNNKSSSSKPRRHPNPSSSSRSLFIQAGVLSDFDSPRTPPVSVPAPPRGNKEKRDSRSGSKNLEQKSVIRNSGGGNNYRYNYPSVDIQGMSSKQPYGESGKDDVFLVEEPIVVLEGKDTEAMATADQTPPEKAFKVQYNYEYSSDFVLGDSSHHGIGFSSDAEVSQDIVEELLGNLEEEDQLHKGLGFSDIPELEPGSMAFPLRSMEVDEGEEELPDEEDMDDDGGIVCHDDSAMVQVFLEKTASPGENAAFLSFGGVRLYTQDISDDESGEAEGSESSDEGSSTESSESDDDSDEISLGDSDIDDDIVEDYLEGIGGGGEILNAKWLAKLNIDVPEYGDNDYDDHVGGRHGEIPRKLGGIALQEASSEYGMKKQRSKKKQPVEKRKPAASHVAWSPALDDLMLVKDPRRLSAKKKHVTQFSRSWPAEARTSKNFRNYPGAKKKHREGYIAAKRRERMMNRGVDIVEINEKLKQMVVNNTDLLSFQRMHSRDCLQVQRLASIYRLLSSCEGSNKKRFVTVRRTQHTGLPSAHDKARLEKLIGPSYDADFAVTETPKRFVTSHSKLSKTSHTNRKCSDEKTERQSGKKSAAYASQPISFISSGVMQSDVTVADLKTDSPTNINVVAASVSIGAFEVHTTGFGSRMLAKMGYVEGAGLGKEGKGISEPIEVTQRPKSLGLGMEFDESIGFPSESISGGNSGGRSRSRRKEPARLLGLGMKFTETGGVFSQLSSGSGGRDRSLGKEPPRVGAFEKHTKGFGSKMMAKMGFVEGMGLGKDSQGQLNPILAVRRPKARGLGAEKS